VITLSGIYSNEIEYLRFKRTFQLTDFEVPDVEEEDEHLEEDQETSENVSFRSQENFQKPGVRHFGLLAVLGLFSKKFSGFGVFKESGTQNEVTQARGELAQKETVNFVRNLKSVFQELQSI
jgi:hypothetical protein